MPSLLESVDADGARMLKILHVAPTFYPAAYWGGPIYSVLGLCDALAHRPGIQLKVLTTDSAGPDRDDRLERHGNVVFPAGYSVYYARRRFGVSISSELLGKLRPMIRWADVVHITGVYSFPTIPTLFECRLFGKPVVWSPRGALQRWQESRRIGMKALWESICNVTMNRRRCVLHVTSADEARESLEKIRCDSAEVIANGVEIPPPAPARSWRPNGAMRLLYVGRLDPKKGIENLLEAMAILEPHVVLDVCGTGPDDYVASLRRRAEKLQLLERVRFHGHIDAAAKSSALWSADVCVVPSHTENFAMVVAESLAHGVPVIASTGTPWEKIVEQGCGAWVSNEPASLAKAVHDLEKRDLASMGSHGREWMQRDFSWAAVAERMETLYRQRLNAASHSA